jgi:hypothetical protein
MKYTVKIADKSYEVEIDDIHTRPVIARVNGQEWKSAETGSSLISEQEATEIKPFDYQSLHQSPGVNVNEMRAPLPGTVIEVFVNRRTDRNRAGHSHYQAMR